MVKDKPFIFAFNVLIVLLGLTLFLFLHYFDIQDKMYVRVSRIEKQLHLND